MKRTAAFLSAGLLGVVALLSGLAIDSYLHAKDPTLVHREGVFSLSNPGHVLLGIGIALVVVGVVGAAYTTLPFGIWVRRAMLGGALLLVAVSGDISGWAASVQWTPPPAGTVAAHVHSAGVAATAQPSAAQLEAAAKLVTDTRAAVARYASLSAAIGAGYKAMEPTDQDVVHYVNTAYLTDADVLNPQHVQSLIYFNGKHGPQLIGAMYMMPRAYDPGPQIGGPLTVWHQHNNICFDDVTGIAVAFVHSADFDSTDKSGSCPRGSTLKVTPEMLHVWLIDNPEGPFASTMAPQVLGTSAAVS
ncbi:MAG TPA: hypothetical protein VFK22_00760 [Candidatus Dormibacteraeota bacterium]|nr:hypothetical protein [Candidatus Dormibacteraeota bacterium]